MSELSEKMKALMVFDWESVDSHAVYCGYTRANAYVIPHYNGALYQYDRDTFVLEKLVRSLEVAREFIASLRSCAGEDTLLEIAFILEQGTK